jgi:hypothetical protein
MMYNQSKPEGQVTQSQLQRPSGLEIMTPKISEDLRQAFEEQGGAPLYLEDAANHRYVLLRAEQFEKVKVLFGDVEEDQEGEGDDVRAFYPLIEQSFGRAGWDDPEMDDYNDYDAHRPKS